ncbi:MAG: class I SAM-dependent methyltransferase [Pseudomonadota bacterium]
MTQTTRRPVEHQVVAGESPVIPKIDIVRQRLRRAWFGFLTLSGLGRRGFFIPHRYAEALPEAGFAPRYEAVEELFAHSHQQFKEVLDDIQSVADDLRAIGSAPPPAPRWHQGWFPRLDAAAAYALVRRYGPRRIVEVGSGHSTRFIASAIERGEINCKITAIDPAPRADIDKLPVTLLRTTLQQAGTAPFEGLVSGDFVMVDSSHILMPGSDVDFLLGRILPLLPAGVLLQVHDIFLPDDYPAHWGWRAYNEQQGILPLLWSGNWEIVFASHYVATRMSKTLEGSLLAEITKPIDAVESSLWLRRKEPPAQ